MKNKPKKFTHFISTTTFSKLLFNTARRLIYPFAPELARGLNVDLSAITSVIALNQATGLLGPVGASFADQYGYRLFMLISLTMLAIGTFALGIIPIYSMLMVCFLLTGLAKSIFDTSLQAYISNLVPLEKRGKIIGITELSWSGSTLIGIPATGWIIQHFSWQTPFFIISGLALVCFFLLLITMPKPLKAPLADKKPMAMATGWGQILQNKKVLSILCFVFFLSIANDNLFVIYGVWLEQSYHLTLVAIGMGTIFIGLAEILGESCTALFADRMGLKPSILTGGLLCSLFCFVLPILDIGLAYVLSGLFLIFFTFEFTMVTAMSLSTELVPELRASTMSAFFATAGLGRMIGAVSGGILWTNSGVLSIALVSGGCVLASLVCFIFGFTKCRIP
ncbi:MAG: MFS transporter [Pseudomonadota bacterium]